LLASSTKNKHRVGVICFLITRRIGCRNRHLFESTPQPVKSHGQPSKVNPWCQLIARQAYADFAGCSADELRAGSNRLVQFLDVYWSAPESVGVWFKSRQLKDTVYLVLRGIYADLQVTRLTLKSRPMASTYHVAGILGLCGVIRGRAQSGIKSPFPVPRFVLERAGIRRRVVQIKAIETEDMPRSAGIRGLYVNTWRQLESTHGINLSQPLASTYRAAGIRGLCGMFRGRAARGVPQPGRPSSQNPTPYTLHPPHYTLHTAPYTLRPAPHTLHPTPYTLHPTLSTLRPTPDTRHPTPDTRHP